MEIGIFGFCDFGFLDKNSDMSDYDDIILDNEVVFVYSNRFKNFRKDFYVYEVFILIWE